MEALFNKDEIIKNLVEELEEELDGIIEYAKFYDSFKHLGLYDDARVIERIAADEYDHAVSLWDLLKKHGVDVSHHEKIQEKWKEVKEIYALP